MDTKNCNAQHSASVMGCGISVEDPAKQLKLWKMPAPSSCYDQTPPGGTVFMAVERLLKILTEKGEPALREICAELKSINILQGEVEVQIGWLLPTISLLSSKLEKIKIALKHCKPLVEAIQ
ncbi:uncharacterized protein LOC115595940, partial [Scomber scombrus]